MFNFSKIQRHLKRARVFFNTLVSSRKFSSNNDIHILVVNDSKVERMLMRDFLDRWGFVASYAEDGEQAVDMMKVQSFDLVFMDGLMPGIPGDHATSRIRTNERRNGLRRTAIVGCSSASAYRERFFDAGADDFIAKPLMDDELLQTIAKWVPRAETKVRPNQS
jgi:CheY-like chemotaxis protein